MSEAISASDGAPVDPLAGLGRDGWEARFRGIHALHEWKHSTPLLGCRFDPLGRFVFAGAGDCQLLRWALADGRMTTLEGHGSWIQAIGFSPDGATTYSAGYDGRLVFWETAAEQPTPLRQVDAHRGWVRALVVHPEGDRLATAGNDRVIRIWSTQDGCLLQELSGHASHIYSLLYLPSGELLSGDLYGEIRHWNPTTGVTVRSLDAAKLHTAFGDHSHFGGVKSLSLSPDGKRLSATGLHEANNPNAGQQWPIALQFDLEKGLLIREQTGKKIGRCILYRGHYHPSGHLMGGLGKQIAFWRPEDPEPLHVFAMETHVLDMDLHPDGVRVATAHFDGLMRISVMETRAEPADA